jgi:signal transduction histidine kinase
VNVGAKLGREPNLKIRGMRSGSTQQSRERPEFRVLRLFTRARLNSLPMLSDQVRRARSGRLWVLLPLLSVLLCVIFGGYEIIERSVLLERLASAQLRLVHILPGIFAAVATGTMVAWYMWRRPIWAFPSAPARLDLPPILDREQRFRHYGRWFVGMRWIAAGVTLALIVITVPIAAILPSSALLPLVGWWIVLVTGNVMFVRWQRSAIAPESQLVIQVNFDLLVLTGLLGASGGLENPFAMLYMIHVIIARILLPRKKAFGLTAVGAVLVVGLAVAELTGLLPHYDNRFFTNGIHASDDLVFVAGRTFALLALMFLTAHLTGIVSEWLRHSEQEMEMLARSAILDRNRLEGVIHSAGLGVLLVARDLSVVWVNSRASDWLGWEARRGGHQCPRAGLDGGCENCLAQRTIAEGRPLEAEREVRGPTGAVRYFRHATSPVRDREGRVVQVMELLEDVTERRALQAQALHAGKLAALGRLAAGIAHEVGNPLSSLDARLRLMERHQDPEFVQESLSLLRAQLERIGRIVRGVTQFAQLRQQKSVLVDVNGTIREAMNMVRLHRRAKETVFEQVLSPSLPPVAGSRDHIVQVLLNLLLNAVDATDHGGKITVETRQHEEGVAVVVADTGCGMDDATRARLFEPFFTTKLEGTGLGLSLSDSLVRANGGRIQVESKPGEGSRFTVVLPSVDVAAHSRIAASVS